MCFLSVDIVSYEANTKLLLEICSKKPVKHEVAQELSILTFNGRHAKVLKNEYSVEDVLREMLPPPTNTTYVCMMYSFCCLSMHLYISFIFLSYWMKLWIELPEREEKKYRQEQQEPLVSQREEQM